MLSAHQVVAIRRAFPEAQIDGSAIRLGRWTLSYSGGRLELPMTKDSGGWHTDGSDEAMTAWERLADVLGR